MEYVDSVGDTAGKIWGFLVKRGRVSLSALEKGVDAPRSVVYMGIGWLAREGKVAMERKDRAIHIWLT